LVYGREGDSGYALVQNSDVPLAAERFVDNNMRGQILIHLDNAEKPWPTDH
jgi:hypothetical protein